MTVTNAGNVTLTGVTVVDPLTGQSISGVTLAPGASQTYNTSYTLTQADLDNHGGGDNDIDNTATADSNETGPVSDSAEVPLVGITPAIAIDKVFLNVTGGDGDALADAVGDVLNYTVTVTNAGNVTLTGVTVVDPLTGQSISGVTLAPGASQTYNTSYTLTQADLDNHGRRRQRHRQYGDGGLQRDRPGVGQRRGAAGRHYAGDCHRQGIPECDGRRRRCAGRCGWRRAQLHGDGDQCRQRDAHRGDGG